MQEQTKAFDQELEDLKSQIKNPNVLIIGQTGVGKSSLINTIFGEEVAKVSNVKPETRGFHKFSSPDRPVNIIDSEGYELENSESFKNTLNVYIDNNIEDVKEQIHIAWYCISLSSARVLPFDLENIAFVSEEKKIPTAVVFTQCDNDDNEGSTFKELSGIINKKFGDKIQCFQVSNDESLNEELDIEKLVEWSANNISDKNVKTAFIIAQTASNKAKYKQAQIAIGAAVTAAAAVAISPIPFSDAPLLIGVQTTMAARIFHIYGLNYGISGILKNVISSRVMGILGKSLAGNILKFIPGVGSGFGAAINVTVASGLTLSMGYALTKMAEKIEKSKLDGTFNEDMLGNIFSPENLESLIKKYNESKKQS